MELRNENILLRDYRLSDIEDEIRWVNEETAWAEADMPWELLEPIDPIELRKDMTEIVSTMPENAIRWRMEIKVNGRHVGLVSSYYLDENFKQPKWEDIDQSKNAAENHMIRALGIEICEVSYWGKGVGTKALTAFMDYYRSLGERRFLLETWSGNTRMLHCAQKLGFTEVKREVGIREFGGEKYDALVMEKHFAE